MIVNEPVHDTFEDTPAKDRDPDWFKRAVFYEVLVRSFQDSNGDGVGDLKGLTAKLDYLQWLGIDCLWLPPFFKSPLRDGGYDVSDYTAVLPEFGDLADFVEFVDAAHQRGMRVIIDFVMNHTSDQHPWFQESRKDPDGPYGDYYVWADDDKQFQDARIIFVDTEASNWTFDPVRKQYFWHRFFSHQPDLNYENPAVQEEMISALRFWLDLGIDGFRLDAVPYLYQQEGTNCENLPATHEFLKRVRKEIDASYPDTVILAEANQWPEDVVDYFGDYESGGDECHMAFTLPGHAPHLHGGPPRVPLPRLGDPRQDPGHPAELPVGHLPAQPRRAHPRNGHRRGTRLHVGRVREGPTDARQHRHPAAPGPAARQRPQPDRAVHRPAPVAPRLADPLLRRRDRHGRQHLARRPGRRPHPDAVDTGP
ncbi:maltose alpha-D-glucosyltransferase/alpha-amylase [Streptomyces sp. SAI-041]|nr:maltose alpha-D-glucosyltransferase/alpha-amylase [Streptomyces sp. SAI-041]